MFDTNKRLWALKISIQLKLRNKWGEGTWKGRRGSELVGRGRAGSGASVDK